MGYVSKLRLGRLTDFKYFFKAKLIDFFTESFLKIPDKSTLLFSKDSGVGLIKTYGLGLRTSKFAPFN